MKGKILLLSLVVFQTIIINSRLQGQIITTLTGGSGVAGFSGDGGAQFSAKLKTPGGVFADNSGNIYIADAGNYRIRKVDTNGIITTVAGNGGTGYGGDGGQATAAQLQPFAVFVDAAGNIIFGDPHNNSVRKISPSGIITRIAGTGVAGYTGDGGPATAAQINAPSGVVADAAGNVYFSDATYRLRKINTSGIISTICGNGSSGFGGDGGPSTLAQISTPGYMHMDNATSTLYFEDNNNNRIRKINLVTGIINTVAGNGSPGSGGDGGQATAAQIHAPGGITLDAAGNLYIADNVNHKVRKVNTSGIISTYAGNGIAGFGGDGGPATAANVHEAIDVAVDIYGHLLIADNLNNRIRIIDNPCSGTPSGGIVNATITTACTLPFTCYLTADGFSVVPGVTYYWQSSPDSVIWTNVPGVIGITCTANVISSPTYYRFVDSCTVSGSPGSSAGIKLGSLPTSAGAIAGSTTVCTGGDITLSNTVSGGVWSAFNGNATVSSSGLVHGVSAGLDIISYTVTNICDTISAIHPVTVSVCDTSGLGANTLVAKDNDIVIFPNPASGAFIIEMPSGNGFTIIVTDIAGKIIVSKEYDCRGGASKVTWKSDELSPGTYFVKAITANNISVHKVVVLN